VSGTQPQLSRKEAEHLDLVQLRGVLEELAARGSHEPVLDVALGLLGQLKELVEHQGHVGVAGWCGAQGGVERELPAGYAQ